MPVADPAPRAGQRLSGVIFDMDGVMVDSEPLSMATIAELAAERGICLESAMLDELAGVSLQGALSMLAARLGSDPNSGELDPGHLRRAYDERYLPRLRATAVPTPGLVQLISGLVAAGIPMAIASSSTLTEIDAVLSALDEHRTLRCGLELRGLLRGVASADEVPRPKPAPDVYLLAIERLGTGPRGVVAIEDSATGVAAATAAGLPCVAVRTAATRTHNVGPAALVVSSLNDLDPAVLERLAVG